MGAFFKPSEEPGVKRAKRSGATLIPGSSDGTLCAAIAEQMSGVARSLRRKTLSLSPPCGWVHFKLPKWVKSKLALTYGVIHLNTMLKVDLIPLKRRAFTREEARRAQPHLLEAGSRPVRVASAEDAVLTKLEWFDMGGRSSGRQWNDILGIMRRQGAALDLAYLRHWADALGVRDLLERALVDAGLKGP